MTKLTPIIFVMLSSLALVIIGCGDKSTGNDHEHSVEVTMSYSPDPATVDTLISFLFEVEENEEHLSDLTADVEIEKEGSTGHVEMAVSEDLDEPGHYRGAHTFIETGSYHLHFEFTHEGEEVAEEFPITVQE